MNFHNLYNTNYFHHVFFLEKQISFMMSKIHELENSNIQIKLNMEKNVSDRFDYIDKINVYESKINNLEKKIKKLKTNNNYLKKKQIKMNNTINHLMNSINDNSDNDDNIDDKCITNGAIYVFKDGQNIPEIKEKSDKKNKTNKEKLSKNTKAKNKKLEKTEKAENKETEDKEINKLVDNLLSSMLMNGNNMIPNRGSVIVEMKTGKIINSSFNKLEKKEGDEDEDSKDSINPLTTFFKQLGGEKKKIKFENINNNNTDLETQHDFAKLETYPVEIIDDNIDNITDILKLAKKFPLVESKKVLDNVDGLYEYNAKYYGINIEKLNKLVSPIEKLNSMIGLSTVKNQILEMILYYMQEFEKGTSNMLHTIIEGPPGVGKTELGKILAEVYSSLGIIPSNKFKLVKRTDLIGEYVGHTAHKTQSVIDDADGGVLFIDEAYMLGGSSEKSDTFSKECIDILNQNLSENKKKLIVIVAGYKEQLESSFFSYNQGLKRRFPFVYTIDGYSSSEIKDIYIKKLYDIGWKLDDKMNDKYLLNFFTNNKDEFKNYGGDIENFILNSKFVHSKRVFNLHPFNRKKLNEKDFTNAFERFKNNKKKSDNNIPYGMFI